MAAYIHDVYRTKGHDAVTSFMGKYHETQLEAFLQWVKRQDASIHRVAFPVRDISGLTPSDLGLQGSCWVNPVANPETTLHNVTGIPNDQNTYVFIACEASFRQIRVFLDPCDAYMSSPAYFFIAHTTHSRDIHVFQNDWLADCYLVGSRLFCDARVLTSHFKIDMAYVFGPKKLLHAMQEILNRIKSS